MGLQSIFLNNALEPVLWGNGVVISIETSMAEGGGVIKIRVVAISRKHQYYSNTVFSKQV
jgi:hypothetical protein